jgi:hypothetical protein
MSVTDHLKDAIEAAEAGRHAQAFGALLAAWRVQPANRIAAAVDAVAERAGHGQVLPPTKTARRSASGDLPAPTLAIASLVPKTPTRGCRLSSSGAARYDVPPAGPALSEPTRGV